MHTTYFFREAGVDWWQQSRVYVYVTWRQKKKKKGFFSVVQARS
jgi:hypothetical protein